MIYKKSYEQLKFEKIIKFYVPTCLVFAGVTGPAKTEHVGTVTSTKPLTSIPIIVQAEKFQTYLLHDYVSNLDCLLKVCYSVVRSW